MALFSLCPILTMKFGSVCSGIEAASVAWNPLGWEAAWFSEIEPFPSAVLKHYYPETPNLGDMTTLPERIQSGEVEAPDLFCGGTPCQAFSVAGQRKSLADARGNLSLTFCEIADVIDSVRSVRGLPPAIVFWENVPGVLSTADNAFGCFLAQLCGGDEPLIAPDGWPDAGCVDGPKRTVSWRVLDAQYFGVAQRRRRVFVVASARDDFDPATVLFEFDGLRRDTAPSRETGQGTAKCLTAGIGKRFDSETEDFVPGSLCARTGQSISVQDAMQGHMVTHTLRGEGFDASEDGTGRGTPLVPVAATLDASFGRLQGCSGQDANHGHSHLVPVVHCDTMPTLRAGAPNGGSGHGARSGDTKDEYIVPMAFHPTQDPIHSTEVCHSIGANENATAAVMQPVNFYGGNKRSDRPEGGFYVRMDEDTSKTLDAASGLNPTCSQGGTAVMQPIPIDTMNHIGRGDSHSFGDFQPGAPSYTLTKGHSHAVAQPIMAPTLTAANNPSRSPQSTEVTQQVWSVMQATQATACEVADTLSVGANQTTGRPGDIASHGMQVRRLTPMECERLQGFPDGYTAIPWRGKPVDECPDGPRYKALGNSWAVPVVRWIGRRIQQEVQGKVPS